MKSFGKISTAIVCCVVALTALNIYFLADLYSDVKAQTVRIVEKCLERADIQEMFERAARFGNTNADTIFINMPLISRSSNNRKIPAYDQLGNWYFRDTTGYFNVTEQFVRVLGQNMHSSLVPPRARHGASLPSYGYCPARHCSPSVRKPVGYPYSRDF